jgi:hypothetical protein
MLADAVSIESANVMASVEVIASSIAAAAPAAGLAAAGVSTSHGRDDSAAESLLGCLPAAAAVLKRPVQQTKYSKDHKKSRRQNEGCPVQSRQGVIIEYY